MRKKFSVQKMPKTTLQVKAGVRPRKKKGWRCSRNERREQNTKDEEKAEWIEELQWEKMYARIIMFIKFHKHSTV